MEGTPQREIVAIPQQAKIQPPPEPGTRQTPPMSPALLPVITALLLRAPLPGAIVRWFDAPSSAYAAGHRGVDLDRKSTRLNSSHMSESRMPSSA